MPIPLGKSVDGIVTMTKSLWAMVATPVGAVLTGIVLALQALFQWLTKDAEGQSVFAKGSAYLGSLLSSLTDIVVTIGKYLYHAFADAGAPLNSFTNSLKKTFVSAVKTVSELVGGLGKTLKGIFETDWDTFKNGVSEMGKGLLNAGKTMVSSVETTIKGVTGSVKLISNALTDDNLAKDIGKHWTDAIPKAKESAALAERETKAKIEAQKAQEKSAKLDDEIAKKREEIYTLTGKAKDAAIEETKALMKARYDDQIKIQKEQLDILKAKNNLHTSSLEDLAKERDLNIQLLRTNAQREASTRMMVHMQQDNLNKMKTSGRAGVSRSNAINTADTKLEEVFITNANERVKVAMDIEDQITEARINAMEDGTEKIRAERDRHNAKELEQIKNQRDSAIEAEYKRQKSEFDAEQAVIKAQGGKTEKWDKSKVDETFINKIKEQYEEIYNNVRKAQEKDLMNAELQSMRDYLKEYGTYQQQKLAIAEEYAEKIKHANTEGERLTYTEQQKQALKSLDEKFGKTTRAMADLFEDSSKKSINAIQSIIDKYELLVSYMSGAVNYDGAKVQIDDLKSVGFSDSDIKSIERGEINIRDVTDAIKNLKGNLADKSPWKSFTNNITDSIKNLKNARMGSDDFSEAITGIGNAVSDFTPALKQFSNNISNIFGFDDTKIKGAIDAVDGLGKTAAGVGQAMSGDIVGGSMAAVDGISKVVNALDGMFGADYSQYNKMKEEYDALNDVWDELISKKQQYIGISYGDEARKTIKEIEELQEKQMQSNYALGIERLNSGASAGSHSIGVRQRKRMSSQGWSELKNAAINIGFDYSSVASGRMTGLFDLTADQLSRLQEEAPTFWAKLDGEVKTYLQNIIDCNDEISNMKENMKETLTGISFDSFYDNFVSTLSDMDKSSEDMVENFEEYLKKSILQSLIANKYRSEIEKLYEDWAKMSDSDEDGIFDLDSEESMKLKESLKSIGDRVKSEIDDISSAFGWDTSSAKSTSQESTRGSYETISQETGEELNGRMTAIHASVEGIREENVGIQQSLNILTVNVNDMLSTNMEVKNIADETRTLIANSYLELVQISENTGAIVKPIRQIQKDIEEVKKNTSRL